MVCKWLFLLEMKRDCRLVVGHFVLRLGGVGHSVPWGFGDLVTSVTDAAVFT